MKEALVKNQIRRIKSIEIAPDIILDLLKLPGGSVVVDGQTIIFADNPIPDGAVALRCGINGHGNVVLLIEHESFSKQILGGAVSELRPCYAREKVDDGKTKNNESKRRTSQADPCKEAEEINSTEGS